jgi:hypothetical protein
MSESKSGFEIRADLLGQAQCILTDNVDRARESIYSHNEVHPESKKAVPVNEVSAQEIISVAKELYEFVNERATSATTQVRVQKR